MKKKIKPLPQWVYDQFADPAVHVIHMPKGDFHLQRTGQVNETQGLLLQRSNVAVHFGGCTLWVNPADGANSGFFPVQIASSTVTTPTYSPPPTQGGSPTRHLSHVTGAITAVTTQLTMDPAELVTVQPGEVVLIWAGVTPSDPVEPAAFIPATVQSVSNGVITFTEPLGTAITNYGSLAGLTAVTVPGLYWKIGAWGTYPSPANFSKGFGLDHGLERFVGGMAHDIALHDLTLMLDPVIDPQKMPNAMWDVSVLAAKNVTLTNVTITNPHSNVLHFWRAFDVLVDGVTLTGSGSNKIWNTQISEAFALCAWGGDGVTWRHVTIAGTDIAAVNTEVGLGHVWLDGLDYDVAFTALRNYASSPTIINFQATRDDPRITNASLRARTTGGTSHIYMSYDPMRLEGALVFPGEALTSVFDFGYQKFPVLTGTVTINGVEYGPAQTTSRTETIISGPGFVDVPLSGLVTSARLRVTTPGDARAVTDSFGNSYWVPGQGDAWIALAANHWHAIGVGSAALAAYVNKYLRVWLNSNASAPDAIVEIETTYLPSV